MPQISRDPDFREFRYFQLSVELQTLVGVVSKAFGDNTSNFRCSAQFQGRFERFLF